jgi:hypothetical protein
MTRFRAPAIAIAAMAISAGTALAFSALPDAASNGLENASEKSGRTLPARPAELPTAVDTTRLDAAAQDLPDAAAHGVDVSTVATSDDPTPDTNRGADVSAAAKDNNGQQTAAEHRPADAGPPADAGKPAGAGKPEGAGQPDDPGQPTDPGAPAGAGKPEGVPAP